MNRIRVNLKKAEDKSYDIVIKGGVLGGIPRELMEAGIAHRLAVVTDSNVAPLYGERLLSECEGEGLAPLLITFPAGEKHKSRETKAFIEDRMLEAKFGRDSAVIALGGGVVGDVAGYVAATYSRGLPYVQIPTTLVACVDSSVGGKTGVDTPHGKNLIGAFHQPWRVYVDVETLTTLGVNEIREGLAEVIKYGVIADAALFAYLEEEIGGVLEYNRAALEHVIVRGCEIKAGVVEKDERESNLRKILNFGHTIGHAVENLSGYAVTHGQAVAIGMVAEGRIAVSMGLWNEAELERLVRLIEKAGLPTEVPAGMDPVEIADAMKLDKKSRGGKIEMVLPESLGRMAEPGGSYGIRIDEGLILAALK